MLLYVYYRLHCFLFLFWYSPTRLIVLQTSVFKFPYFYSLYLLCVFVGVSLYSTQCLYINNMLAVLPLKHVPSTMMGSHMLCYIQSPKIFLLLFLLLSHSAGCFAGHCFLNFFNSFTLYVLCVFIMVIMCTSLCPYINIVLEVLPHKYVYSLYCG